MALTTLNGMKMMTVNFRNIKLDFGHRIGDQLNAESNLSAEPKLILASRQHRGGEGVRRFEPTKNCEK